MWTGERDVADDDLERMDAPVVPGEDEVAFGDLSPWMSKWTGVASWSWSTKKACAVNPRSFKPPTSPAAEELWAMRSEWSAMIFTS